MCDDCYWEYHANYWNFSLNRDLDSSVKNVGGDYTPVDLAVANDEKGWYMYARDRNGRNLILLRNQTSDFADIPAVTIPVGDFVITPTNIVYQEGDIPVAYGYQGHSGHMIVEPHVASGKWGITRRNPYSVQLESTAVKLYILR